MNEKSEQIDSALNYALDYDQPLDWRKEIFNASRDVLGDSKFSVLKLTLPAGKYNVGKYVSNSGITHIFLLAAVTFLGGNGNHPVFKKRIQLKEWFKQAYNKLSSSSTMVHFTGVYHYKGNVIFVDFGPETYVPNKMHNSSAFVYVNDLYRAMKDGIAKRKDFNGHAITTISRSCFKKYIDSLSIGMVAQPHDDLIATFTKFNLNFPFMKWIKGIDAISEMWEHKWPDWRQTEWPGWFLEYKFSSFLDAHKVSNVVFCRNKKASDLDFDLWFPDHKFYGDLKASDEIKSEAPGNDQENLIRAINKYDRFWYAIFEHETVKDSDSQQKFVDDRIAFIITKDGIAPAKSEKKKHRDLKNRVFFNRMLILEINRFNYQNMLKVFNQGKQPDGKPRKKKFLVRKHLPVELENFQILHYSPPGKQKTQGPVYTLAGISPKSLPTKSV